MLGLDRLLILARRLARLGVWFGGGLLVIASFIIGVDVVIRKLFGLSIGGADELSGFALAIGSAWAFGFTLLDRGHVRIDSLYVVLPTRICAVLDIFGLLALTTFFSLVAWYGFGAFSQSFALNAHTMSPLATPLIYPQFLWVLGLGWFVVIAVLLLGRAMMALILGDMNTVQRLIGSRTVVQEIDDELRGLEHGDGPTSGGER